MPKIVDQITARSRRGLPFGLTGLPGLTYAAYCAIPLGSSGIGPSRI
ncbi:hypothetical protein [Micromonospora sp. NPDC005324]